jgi:hypothetical protein
MPLVIHGSSKLSTAQRSETAKTLEVSFVLESIIAIAWHLDLVYLPPCFMSVKKLAKKPRRSTNSEPLTP